MSLNKTLQNSAKKNRTVLGNINNRDVPNAASESHHMPLPSSFLHRMINGINAVPVGMAGGPAGMLPEQRRSSAIYLQRMCGNHFLQDMACGKMPTSGDAKGMDHRANDPDLPDAECFDFAGGSSYFNSFIPRKISICSPTISVLHMASNPARRYSGTGNLLQRKTADIDISNLNKYKSESMLSGIIYNINSYNSIPMDSIDYSLQIDELNLLLKSCNIYISSVNFNESSSRGAASLEVIREVSSIADAVKAELELVIGQSKGIDLSQKKEPVCLSILSHRRKGHDSKRDLNRLISEIEKRHNVFISRNRGPRNHEPISSTSEESKGFVSSMSSANPDNSSLSLGVFAALQEKRLKKILKDLKTKSNAESLRPNLQKSLANIKEREWTKYELKRLDKVLGVYGPILSGSAKAEKINMLLPEKLKIFRINQYIDENMNLLESACGVVMDRTNIFFYDIALTYKPGVDVVYYHELCHALLAPLLPKFEKNISYWVCNTFCRSPTPDQRIEIKQKCEKLKIELPVNDYGMTNPDEDMATTIELSLTDPEKLKKISFERFSFAENYVRPLLNMTSIKIKPSSYYRDPSEKSCGCVII